MKYVRTFGDGTGGVMDQAVVGGVLVCGQHGTADAEIKISSARIERAARSRNMLTSDRHRIRRFYHCIQNSQVFHFQFVD